MFLVTSHIRFVLSLFNILLYANMIIYFMIQLLHLYFYSEALWGNKLGCYDVEYNLIDIDNGTIKLFYDTAWDISANFWKKITTQYQIKVINYFHEEASFFCGEETYQNGNSYFTKLYKNCKTQKKEFIEYASICGKNLENNYYDNDDNDNDNNENNDSYNRIQPEIMVMKMLTKILSNND
jgi:hypothetical protein